MPETKNAKISAKTHKRLRMLAAKNELPIGVVIESACEVGLSHEAEITQQAAKHTTQEPHKEPLE